MTIESVRLFLRLFGAFLLSALIVLAWAFVMLWAVGHAPLLGLALLLASVAAGMTYMVVKDDE